MRLLPNLIPQTTRSLIRCQHTSLRQTGVSVLRHRSRWTHTQTTTKPDVLDILTTRGYVKDIAGERDTLQKLLLERQVGFYAGIDPTAPSLHLGHLLPLMILFWLYLHGHRTVSLIGGATAQVGDPSGRLTSRAKTAQTTHTTNTEALTKQVAGLWKNVEAYGQRHGYGPQHYGERKLLDNKEWLLQLNVVEFLRTLGSTMRIGTMLGRDTVKNKMENGDGMSFAEFTYPLLQGWDWWHMYQHEGVQVQIGGSDQFGNIVAGLEAVKAAAQASEGHRDAIWRETSTGSIKHDYVPMGLTTPLLTTSRGEKFGKSAGNAVWLNHEMTSTFDLYGFLLRTADTDVESYLNLFTFVSVEKIAATVAEHDKDRGLRLAQHLLAAEVLELVHGAEAAKATARRHRSFRMPATRGLMPDAETITLPRTLVASAPFARILYHAGLVSSKSEGARMVKSGGVYVASSRDLGEGLDAAHFVPMKDVQPEECGSFAQKGTWIVRMGKWKVRVIEVVDDETYNQSGLQAPGWEETRNDTTGSCP